MNAKDVKLILAPKVRLISRQQIDITTLSEFLAKEADAAGWMSDASEVGDELPEIAGRLCYNSYKAPRPGGNAAYIKHIIESGHGRVLEHSVLGFLITGVSRSLAHEFLTHKIGISHSELSQRFVDCSEISFVVPPAKLAYYQSWTKMKDNMDDRDHPEFENARRFRGWLMARVYDLEEYQAWYAELQKTAPEGIEGTDLRKWCRSASRDCLPACTETRFFVTANLRAWRNTIEMRCSKFADAEIRRLFNAVFPFLVSEAPAVFSDYTLSPLPDGTQEITTKFKKV